MNIGARSFQARIEGERHHCLETILSYVQRAPDSICWENDRNEFDELSAIKKESAPGPEGIPFGLYRCAGGLGSRFLHNVCKHVLEGGVVPALFAESRTVFIPKSSDVDNNGRIVSSAEALRPLTLCNCDSKFLTSAICRGLHWYTMRCIHPSKRCISSRQMTDNIFEIETTALAHVACAPRESGILLTDFAAAYPCVNHSWIFHVPEKTEVPKFICRFLQKNLLRVRCTCGICRNAPWTIPHGQGCEARLSCERIPICDGLKPHLSLAPGRDHSQEPC